MRHDGSAENADSQNYALAAGKSRQHAQRRLVPIGVGDTQLDQVTQGDDADHGGDQAFQGAKAESLQDQDGKRGRGGSQARHP